jgi:ribosomal protein S18 acetylase RimI-like enzyme
MDIDTKILGPDESEVLERLAPGVFDDPLDAEATARFLTDPRHHVAVATEDGLVVGAATSVHYLHPDKSEPEMWINELAVAPTHRGRGLGKALLGALLETAREQGCREAWIVTDPENEAAMRLYRRMSGQEAARNQVMFTFRLEPE